MKKVILTGDRPTGKLHLGHYVGSLKNRVDLQNSGEYDTFIMIADLQALTDNAKNPAKIRDNILEVALDYLAVGLDPAKTTIFIQSQIPALSELTMYYMNLVSLSRVLRNPTVKTEIAQKEFGETVPAGFAMYPISQAADITAFNAALVPVGVDQLPMIEQAREIVRSFNQIYGETLVEPDAKIPDEKDAQRLPGIDGNAKMSKSLDNGIYLADDEKTLHDKVFAMFTDPDHIHVEDPGKVAGNTVFTYLDVFAKNSDDGAANFAKFYSEFKNLTELKTAYQNGGIGDVKIKKFLFEVLNEILKPIRERRENFAKDPEKVYEMLETGSEKANLVANETLMKVREAIGVNYFDKK
jgi:tryptophanyl-tRNA synthetase